LAGGKYIQIIVDAAASPSVSGDSSDKYFDIIGFDPRGVNNTTPRLKCYPNSYNQQTWMLKQLDYGLLWDAESILGLEWARAEAQGASCSQGDPETDMVRFVNTAQVVEDMVAIIERHGEWRAREASNELRSSYQTGPEEKKKVLERTSWRKGKEKLQFWGFSYGTLLGATFAAMHPNLVHRVVLDGNLNPDDYYSGARLKNLQNSDMILTKYCEYCFQAGPEKCPLYLDTSAADIEARVTRIMMDLRSNPIAVARPGMGPEVVMYGDMHLQGMLSAMYFPFTWGERFFSLLFEAERGNGTQIAELKQAWMRPESISEKCLEEGPCSEACIAGNDFMASLGPEQCIACMDQGGRGNLTKSDFLSYWAELEKQSKWISRSWARGRIGCVGYTVEPAWRFEGEP